MSDFAAFDFRKSTKRILQGYVGVTAGGDLALPVYAGVWTVITEVHMTMRATDGHYYVWYVGVQGPGFTACPFTSFELETSETDARSSWYGHVNIDDSMTAYASTAGSGSTATFLFVGYFQPSEGTS